MKNWVEDSLKLLSYYNATFSRSRAAHGSETGVHIACPRSGYWPRRLSKGRWPSLALVDGCTNLEPAIAQASAKRWEERLQERRCSFLYLVPAESIENLESGTWINWTQVKKSEGHPVSLRQCIKDDMRDSCRPRCTYWITGTWSICSTG